MSKREFHVVIGAGVAGCTAAILRRLAGYEVVIVEKARSNDPQIYPVCTETSTVVSENHSGAEYPYDPRSTTDCLDGRIANAQFFPDFLYAGKTATRILASARMIAAGDDIAARCRNNLDIITQHYRGRVAANAKHAVFGAPETLCHELEEFDGVNDVAAAFLTPQRGLNPVYAAALLEAEIKRLEIGFQEGCQVTKIETLADGRLGIHCLDQQGARQMLQADQVCIAAAGRGFHLSKMLNPGLDLPGIYVALRLIAFVALPQDFRKTATCLKLEDQYGGMLSPLNQECAMIYYPPAAHIETALVDPASGALPAAFLQALAEGHPETEQRAQQTLRALQAFYPELTHARIVGAYLKLALNTTDISRMRRNMPVFQVTPGCTLIVLPKWTMAVVNARKDLELALGCSQQRGRLSAAGRQALGQQVDAYTLPVPRQWSTDFPAFLQVALGHASNMRLPATVIAPMGSAF
ncbi:MAG TPA: FAD-dependent oxidoreductase [Ktedonobacteraceae bacterium]|jgi:glycine/D-amino acid oxidase-like deaminating enzyme